MKNTSNKKSDEMRYEYDFSNSKPNKYAAILKKQDHLVSIEPDVFEYFRTSEQVNNALRAFINAIPKKNKKKLAKV